MSISGGEYKYSPESVSAALSNVDKVENSLNNLMSEARSCLSEAQAFISAVASLTGISIEISVDFDGAYSSYITRLKGIFSDIWEFGVANQEIADSIQNELKNPLSTKEIYDKMSDIYNTLLSGAKGELGYLPELKEGEIKTHLLANNNLIVLLQGVSGAGGIKYSGEYIEFENKGGISVQVPLAITKYEDGKIVFVPMTEEEKEKYIEKITQYYNDTQNNFESLYTDNFKDEINKRVDSITMLYIDPETKDYIEESKGLAAYCLQAGLISNHSNIAVFSEQFVNLNDENNYYNSQEAYDYMMNTFTHECGHAYANKNIFLASSGDRDGTNTWKDIYNQVSDEDSNRQILGDYAFKNNSELFAESTMYYFHDPDRLKMVDIDIDGYDTLYDYMDDVLN